MRCILCAFVWYWLVLYVEFRRKVYTGLIDLYPKNACKQFNCNLRLLQKQHCYTADNIPQLEDVSKFLQSTYDARHILRNIYVINSNQSTHPNRELKEIVQFKQVDNLYVTNNSTIGHPLVSNLDLKICVYQSTNDRNSKYAYVISQCLIKDKAFNGCWIWF